MQKDKESLFQALFQEKRIDQLDIDVSQHMHPASFLGMYLTKAFRAGYMFVEIQNGCTPAPATIFLDAMMQSLSDERAKQIEGYIVEEFRSKDFPLKKVRLEGEKVFFPYAEAIERSIIKNITHIAEAQPDISLSLERKQEFLQKDPAVFSLHIDQRNAVETLLETTCGFLTGGPGTGKTMTAGIWLKALEECASCPLHVALAAPTGRAAQTLAGSLKKRFDKETSFDVQTIHRLLLSPFSYIPYNVLIVDECSMIDSALFAQLLVKIRPGTRVLFLGDPDQLPPIDAGQPFSCLLASLSKGIKKASLSVSFRTESKEILDVAHAFLHATPIPQSQDSVFYRSLHDLESIIEEYIVRPWEKIRTTEEASALLRETIFLTPTRVGSLGTEQINRFIRSKRKENTLTPVVFLKNNHDLGVMNGDLGILELRDPLNYIHSFTQTLPAAICPRYEEAYAMSVHKSQGSEFYRVILLISPGVACSPHLLYTAATRARRELIVVS